MEKTTIITDTYSQKLEEFKNTPYTLVKKKLRNSGLFTNAIKEYVYENDDKIVSAMSSFQFHFLADRFYSKIESSKGITYNKKTKKLTIWGNKKTSDVINTFKILLRYMNVDWFLKLKDCETYSNIDFNRLLTKTISEKIVNGKIKNPEQLFKTFLQSSYKQKNIPWKLVRDLLNNRKLKQFYDISLMTIFNHTTNPISALVKLTNGSLSLDYLTLLNDTFNQCFILNKKVNLSWSYKRLADEHEKMTTELMEEELNTKDNTPIEYIGDVNLLNGMTIINNEVDAFKEANFMHNCIYTNYWNKIASRRYVVIKYLKDNVTYDIGIFLKGMSYFNKETACIDQIQAIRNTRPPQEIIDEINEWFSQTDVLDFFNQQTPIESIKSNEMITLNYDMNLLF